MNELTPVSAIELQLADEALDRLLMWVPEFADPSDIEFDGVAEPGSSHGDALSACSADESLILERVALPALRYIRERDDKLATSGYAVVAPYNLVDITTRDDDGRIDSYIAAAIGDPEHGHFLIELRLPFNMGWIRLLSGLSLSDRIRLLTEVVRTMGNLIRFARLSDGVRRELVRGLRDVVGLLRAAVRDASEQPTDQADDAGSGDADPSRGDVMHPFSVGEGQR
ncbi:MAG: hypothetical protein QM630_01095 [Microbacterium sp.]